MTTVNGQVTAYFGSVVTYGAQGIAKRLSIRRTAYAVELMFAKQHRDFQLGEFNWTGSAYLNRVHVIQLLGELVRHRSTQQQARTDLNTKHEAATLIIRRRPSEIELELRTALDDNCGIRSVAWMTFQSTDLIDLIDALLFSIQPTWWHMSTRRGNLN